ncbi:hypothetical protein OIDMADRAFT_20710, partial [Oidiodendron maius Zn]
MQRMVTRSVAASPTAGTNWLIGCPVSTQNAEEVQLGIWCTVSDWSLGTSVWQVTLPPGAAII